MLDGIIETKREIAICEAYVAMESDPLNAQRLSSDVDQKTRLQQWKRALDQWTIVMKWIENRNEHFDFLLEFDKPFSKKFIEQSAEYFIFHVNRRSFNLVKKRAECCSETVKGHYDHNTVFENTV